MNKQNHLLNNIALFLALLFHISGLIGILLTPYKEWFINNTPVNLLVMFGLIIITHPSKNKTFFLFLVIAAFLGFIAEAIGVNTGFLFGKYSYGNVLGLKILNVPVVIGINWVIIIYCTGMITQSYENYMLKKINERGLNINKQMKLLSFLADASLLAVLFDWIIEPVAQKLGYWQWENNKIPQYNYICWLLVSVGLLAIFRKLNRNDHNLFAVHLFIIQLLFFLVLRSFL